MKTRYIVPVVLALLTGLPAAGRGEAAADPAPDPARVAAFVDVLKAHDCRMTPYEADKEMPKAGFADAAETKAITAYLVSQGRARILDGRLVVFGGDCGQGPQYSVRERFFAALADNGCSMSNAEASALLPRVGIQMAEVNMLMHRMTAMSEVRISPDGERVTLESGLCEAFAGLSSRMVSQDDAAAAKGAQAGRRSGQELRAAFLSFMGAHDCRMTRSDSQVQLPAAGFTPQELRPVIAGMLKTGEARMEPSDDSLVISQELCPQ